MASNHRSIWHGSFTAPMVILALGMGCGDDSGDTLQPVPMQSQSGPTGIFMPPEREMTTSSNDEPADMETDQTQAQTRDIPSEANAEPPPASMDAPETDAPSVSVATLDLSMAYQNMLGLFDNRNQAAVDTRFDALRLFGCEADVEELGQRVVYLERAPMMQPSSGRVQWLYAIRDNSDGRIAADRYEIIDGQAAPPSCSNTAPYRVDMTNLVLNDGCTLYFEPADGGFKGTTAGNSCSLDHVGGAYVHTEVQLHRNAIKWSDLAYSESGMVSENTPAEPFIFERFQGEPMADETPDVVAEPNAPMNDEVPAGMDSNDLDPGQGMFNDDAEMMLRGGDTCADAVDLAEASFALDPMDSDYTHRILSNFGDANDYNPQQDSGLAPSCSIVFDAPGRDVVFSITLQPGQSIDMLLTVNRRGSPGGLYMLDNCEQATAPDFDGNGLCGDDTYKAIGHCGPGCAPMTWTFTWPSINLEGLPNPPQTLFLVVDEINSARAGSFILDWRLRSP